MRRLGLLLILATACEAECKAGEVTVNGEKVHEDASVPRSLVLNAAYGAKHGLDIPLEARVEVPRGDSPVVLEGEAAGGAWIRFDYPDQSGDKIAERVSIAGLHVDPGPEAERLAALEQLIMTQVFPQAAGPGGKYHGSRPATVDGKRGVMVIGETTMEGEAVMLGVVGVLLPEQKDGLMVVGQSVVGKGPIGTPDAVGSTGALHDVLQSLRFGPG